MESCNYNQRMLQEYLAQRKFIHRDLAARNILLYSHRQLKISDFGLARDVYETNMYQPTSARKLPYKWMPIESIFDQVFTIKSDVYVSACHRMILNKHLPNFAHPPLLISTNYKIS